MWVQGYTKNSGSPAPRNARLLNRIAYSAISHVGNHVISRWVSECNITFTKHAGESAVEVNILKDDRNSSRLSRGEEETVVLKSIDMPLNSDSALGKRYLAH